jgi:hypothetical protein
VARKQRDVVDYFPHDSNACSGDTLTVLQSKYGNDGYALWFKLLEMLSATEGHYLNLNKPMKWQLFLAKMGITEITATEMLALLANMEAIDKKLWQSKVIWCQKLVNNFTEVYRKRGRETPQKPIPDAETSIPDAEKDTTTDIPDAEMPQSKVKYSKVNEIPPVVPQGTTNIELPEWINKETWDAFEEMRKQIKSPLTEKAKKMAITKLSELKKSGDDPNKVLEQTIIGNYKGLFPLKDGGSNGKGPKTNSGSVKQGYNSIPDHYTHPDEIFWPGYTEEQSKL